MQRECARVQSDIADYTGMNLEGSPWSLKDAKVKMLSENRAIGLPVWSRKF